MTFFWFPHEQKQINWRQIQEWSSLRLRGKQTSGWEKSYRYIYRSQKLYNLYRSPFSSSDGQIMAFNLKGKREILSPSSKNVSTMPIISSNMSNMDPERHLKHQASLLDCRLSNDASIPIKQIKTTYQLGERRKKFCFVRTEKKNCSNRKNITILQINS